LTETALLPSTDPLEENALAEIVCVPFATLVEFHVDESGGPELRYFPSM
jgi:hypothetical protein